MRTARFCPVPSGFPFPSGGAPLSSSLVGLVGLVSLDAVTVSAAPRPQPIAFLPCGYCRHTVCMVWL